MKHIRFFSKSSPSFLVAITAVAAVLLLTTAGLLTSTQNVPSSGNISTLNVQAYSDSACTIPITNIDWGSIRPGESTTRTFYLKNNGNTPLTLSLSTGSWSSNVAQSVLTLTWNRAGVTLNAAQSTQAILTLAVASNPQGITSFSFNVVISGTG